MKLTDKDTITIDARFNASVENVWKAWTDPDLILQWFGSDPKGEGVKAALDVHPGGNFEITFRNSDQTEYTCFGKYVEVQKYGKLSFTWEWKNEPGVESFVTLLFSSENNLTRMQFEHAKVGAKSAHDYSTGWKATFAKLERILSNKTFFT